jgi:dual specificity MAP kinase phosphatase
MQDSCKQNLLEKLPEALRFIDDVRKINGRIFVHCQAGISRSVSVVMAYIIWTQRMESICAFEMISEYRSCAGPNLHFMGQLLIFQKNLPDDTSDINLVEHTVSLALTQLSK